jgi:hypothetical protein
MKLGMKAIEVMPVKFPVLTALLAICMAASAAAAERRLTGSGISETLAGHVFAGDDGGRKTEQIFHKGGATFYSVNGSQSQGRWEVRGDRYCSQWPPSEIWSCYDVLEDGAAVTFLAASGKRYSVKRLD